MTHHMHIHEAHGLWRQVPSMTFEELAETEARLSEARPSTMVEQRIREAMERRLRDLEEAETRKEPLMITAKIVLQDKVGDPQEVGTKTFGFDPLVGDFFTHRVTKGSDFLDAGVYKAQVVSRFHVDTSPDPFVENDVMSTRLLLLCETIGKIDDEVASSPG